MKTRKEKIAEIKRLIPDENLRHIIFNFEDESKDITVSLDGKTEVYELIDDVNLGTYDGKIEFSSFKAHNAKVLVCVKQ